MPGVLLDVRFSPPLLHQCRRATTVPPTLRSKRCAPLGDSAGRLMVGGDRAVPLQCPGGSYMVAVFLVTKVSRCVQVGDNVCLASFWTSDSAV